MIELRQHYLKLCEEWDKVMDSKIHKKFTVMLWAKLSDISYKHLRRALRGERIMSERFMKKALDVSVEQALQKKDNQ